MTKAQLEKKAAEMNTPVWTEVGALLEDVIEWEAGDEKNAGTFEMALSRRMYLDSMKKTIEAELKSLNDALLVEMRAAEIGKVKIWDGMTFEVRNGTSPSRIEATKLLENGVPVEVIQAATTEGKAYQFVMVVKPKAAKEG